jgi:hypothetical protein
MKHHFASWFSLPVPNGLQYAQTRPYCPLWAGAGCGCGSCTAGAVGRGYLGAAGVGAAWVTSGACVILSRAWDTTSAHDKVLPCSAAFVARRFSNAVCIAWSNLGTKQCKVASSLAPSDLLSYSTRSMKLYELSLAIGRNPKYLALSWLEESPNSRLTTDLKSPQSVKLWLW